MNDEQAELAILADAISQCGVNDETQAMLGSFVVVAEFLDSEGEGWVCRWRGTGTGGMPRRHEIIGLLRCAQIREEDAFSMTGLETDDDD